MNKASLKKQYICSICNSTYDSWSGRCLSCGEWNSLEMSTQAVNLKTSSANKLKLDTLIGFGEKDDQRIISGIKSVDQVFGGGIVLGSVNLISGEPGIGKSTLLLQIAAAIADNNDVLYVSGEESAHQVALRGIRLKLNPEKLKITASSSSDQIASEILSQKFKLVIVDSIQTLKCEDIGSAPGSVSQITNSASLLTQAAKSSNTALIIVGHITKEGNLAGPKLLEHIVDVVLSLEGDQSGGLKLLKVSKNRFGSTNETAIFSMAKEGLGPVLNPSAILLAERKITDGSVVLATMEGSRPILVEVQALVNSTSYGYPKRAVSGLDLSRLNLLIAMIERRTSLRLGNKDVYLNIVGGLKVSEPAADLAVVMAICSAAKAKKLKYNAVVFGEVGLSGEIRHVPFIDRRIAEAKSLGFDYAIGPKTPNTKLSSFLKPIEEIKTALNLYLE